MDTDDSVSARRARTVSGEVDLLEAPNLLLPLGAVGDRSTRSAPAAGHGAPHRILGIGVSATLLAASFAGAQGLPRFPFPQHVAYVAGSIAPSHRTQGQLDADVRAAYGRWKTAHLLDAGSEPDGQPRYRVRHAAGANPDTVSEGQGYGLVIVALLAGDDPAARTIFDGLWEYFNDHRSVNDARLMDWNVPADEMPNPPDDDSAFDGDADIAFGLLLADRQWGSSGRIDYRREALEVIAGLEASCLGPSSRLPLLGDWVDPAGAQFNERTVRTSDFMPGHFRAFAQASGHAGWNQAVDAVVTTALALRRSFAPTTGLLPDFTVPVSPSDPSPRPAPPYFLEAETDGDWSWNAGRDPWRFAADALLSGDADTTAIASRMTNWARAATGGNPLLLHAGYHLDGTPVADSDYFSSFFASPLGTAAMLVPARQSWLNGIWDAVRDEQQGYYEDTVTLLAMLLMSRNFWSPLTTAAVFADGFETGDLSAWSATAP